MYYSGIKPYICEIDNCMKPFQSPHLLKRHKALVHSNIKKFKCDICDREFKLKCALTIHQTYHGDPQIPCPVCSKLVRNE